MAERELTEQERALAGPRALKEVGSPEWCWQTVSYLKDSVRHVGEQWRRTDVILAELKEARAWKVIPPEKPYGSFDEMLRAETGLTEAEIQARIEEVALGSHGGDRRSEQFQGDNIPLKSQRGTSKTHLVRRLKRDNRQDLAERVSRGDMSAQAAAREAGYKAAKQRRVSVHPTDPELIAASLKQHLAPDVLAALVKLLTS